MQKSAEAQERSKTPGPEGASESVEKKVKGVGKRKPEPQMTKKTTAKQSQQEEQQLGASAQIAQSLLPWEADATLLKPFGELEAIIDKRKRNLEKRKVYFPLEDLFGNLQQLGYRSNLQFPSGGPLRVPSFSCFRKTRSELTEETPSLQHASVRDL